MGKTLGQIGYEAYGSSTGGKTFDGRDMPTWEEIVLREGATPKVEGVGGRSEGDTERALVNFFLVAAPWGRRLGITQLWEWRAQVGGAGLPVRCARPLGVFRFSLASDRLCRYSF